MINYSRCWSALFRLVGVSLSITIFRIGRANPDSVILNLEFFIENTLNVWLLQ